MITVGPMALNQPQAADPMEPFFLGTQSGGGYWTDISRLSSHDHSGGLMGAAVAVNIPDGSITAADLDPSVLAPYALVDGSKPFTGQVTMQADAIIRDALSFGQQGTALAPDVTLTRTAAGVLGLTGALSSATGTLGRLAIGATGTVTVTPDAGANGVVVQNGTTTTWLNPANTAGYDLAYRDDAPGGGGRISLRYNGTQRAYVGTTGTLTVTPESGVTALSAGGAGYYPVTIGQGSGTNPRITGTVGSLELAGASNFVLIGPGDSTNNVGSPTHRVATYYGVTGTIQTSSQDMKEGITPLDPAAAMAAVRATEPVTFTYKAPKAPPARQQAYRRPAAQRFDWRAERDRLVARPLEAGARKQAGFVAEQAHPLFLTGTGQTNAANTAGIYLGALRDLDARLQALEAN